MSKHYDELVAGALTPTQLRAYFGLTEVATLLQYAVRRQLQADGGLSYVQFEILMKLAHTDDPLTMTDLADGVVYSRSGLTHQADLLERQGLITRTVSSDDLRVTVVDITTAGHARVAQVLPGHVELVRDNLIGSLKDADVEALANMMDEIRVRLRQQPPRSAVRKRKAPVDPMS